MAVKSTTTADAAYKAIRRMLFDLEFQPGDRLSQTKLANRIGCSTVPVVEAMRRLESDGLLVKEGRRMARVRRLSAHELEELYLIREGLEPIVARRCALRISEEQGIVLQRLSEAFDKAAKANDYMKCEKREIEIHRFIAECAECPLIANELERLAVVRLTAGRALEENLVPHTYPYQHRALTAAICDRDADMAEYLMRKHIRQGFENVKTHLDAADAKPTRRKASRKRKHSAQDRS